MQALNTAVVEFLRTNIPSLDGRVHSGVIPTGEGHPSAVVDSSSQHDPTTGLDAGLERATVTIRCQDEDSGDGDDVATSLAELSGAVEDSLTGRDSSAPALEVGGYEILDVSRYNSLSYADEREGRRMLYSVVEMAVTLERETA